MKCFKSFKKLLSLVAAAAMLVTVPVLPSLKADAEEPMTFYLKYDIDKHQWRMQENEWLEDYEGRELYYLNQAKDGDIVVVLSNEEQSIGNSDISINARLSNLTVNRASVVIKANAIDNCYVLGESYAAITGPVTNAYVYDDAKCTFHSNVTNLHLVSSEKNDVDVDVSVVGTVAYTSVENPGGIVHEYYNFVANTFYYDHASGLMTEEANYSKSGSAPAAAATTVTAPAAEVSQPASNTAAATANNTSNSNDYDNVPKTGESNLVVWLLGLSVLNFIGCLMFLRKATASK